MNLRYTIEKKNIRSLRIRLTSRHTFVVSAPIFTPLFIIKKFINDNQEWLETHAKKFPVSPAIKGLKEVIILDQKYELIIKKTSLDSLIVDDKSHQIFVNTSILSSSHLKKLIDKKLRNFALKLIKNEINLINKDKEFKINNITVRNQTSRFGSCSSRGNLNFNWQMIFFPYPIFRHLIYHELTHLSVKNHKKEFWEQLSKYDPDYKIHNQYLKSDYKKHLLC